MSTPSEPAWRAAVEIQGLDPASDAARDLANVIDRETGLPELLAACKAFADLYSDRLSPAESGSPLGLARDAIAKAEGT